MDEVIRKTVPLVSNNAKIRQKYPPWFTEEIIPNLKAKTGARRKLKNMLPLKMNKSIVHYAV